MRTTRTPSILAAGLFAFVAAFPASAWEYVYGPAGTAEQGFRRVTPSTACPVEGLGYLSVGTLDQFGGAPDVYAVYTTLAGVRVWEFSYDVGGSGLPDEGMAVAELPGNGFVILSNSNLGGVWRIALTHVACNGTVLWSRVYRDGLFGDGLRGHDMIRTANGDLAIAGVRRMGAVHDAYLLRVTAAGAFVWNAAYDSGGDEIFYALAETVSLSDPVYLDLVAVGSFDKGNGDLQGLVARVDGGTGNIGAAPQCIAEHGNAGSHEVYRSVTALTNQLYFGQLAMTGTTTGAGWLDDVWMTRGNPCALAAQSRIGNPAGGGLTAEQGLDLRETAGPGIGPAGGSLAVAGSHRPALGFTDASFLEVATGTLMPLGATGRLFGGAGDEVFHSLTQNPAGWSGPGFTLAGSTETAWTPGDPRDLYLVHYDPYGGRVGCERSWSPGGIALGWPQSPLHWQRVDPTRSLPAATPAIKHLTALRVCP